MDGQLLVNKLLIMPGENKFGVVGTVACPWLSWFSSVHVGLYMYVCIYIYKHIYNTQQRCKLAFMHTCVHTYIHTYIHTNIKLHFVLVYPDLRSISVVKTCTAT